MQNYLQYTNKTNGIFFQAMYLVLESSVATCVHYGRIVIDSFTANLLQSVVVKEF